MNKKEYVDYRLENIGNDQLKWLYTLCYQYEYEAYIYFDENIKELPKLENGAWDFSTGAFHNSPADAYRHAYTSGMFVFKFNEIIADAFGYWFFNDDLAVLTSNLLGQANEIKGRHKGQPPAEENMDLWNNKVGREYAKLSENKEHLSQLLHKALNNKELITTIDQSIDNRVYTHEESNFEFDTNKPLVVVSEKETGRNEWFFDLSEQSLLKSESLIAKIENGMYQSYTIADIDGIPHPSQNPIKSHLII